MPPMSLLDPLFRYDALDKLFFDEACIQGMLDFEAALARAEATSGIVAASQAQIITGKCRAENFDLTAIARDAALAGNLAIPLVKKLTELVAHEDKDAARFVHWGATSQDVIDTGCILQVRGAFDLIDQDLARLSSTLVTLTEKHRATPIVARTWMQQALPTALGLCTGTLGKIARDISLHAQTEIAELSEPSAEGRGGSSTMPHKRNPVTCAVVLAAAARIPSLVATLLSAMPQEEQRGLGGWHAEWETLPDMIRLYGGALHHLAEMLPGLEVDTERMRHNLELTNGLIFAEAVTMALGDRMGKMPAHLLVEAACKKAREQKRHLKDILREDSGLRGHLTPADLESLFDARNYLGSADEFIRRVVAEAGEFRAAR